MSDLKCRLISVSVGLAASVAVLAGPGCSLPPPPPPEPIVLASVGSPFALAVDSTTAYISSSDVGPLVTVPVDGGKISWSDARRVGGKALAVDDDHLYWSDGTGVFRCDKSSCDTSRTTLAMDDAYAVVVSAGTVYWSTTKDASGQARIMRADPGLPPVQIATGGSIYGLAVDGANVYWIEQSPPRAGIMATSIDGRSTRLLTTMDPSTPFSIALGPDDVYYTTSAGKLMQVSKTGGASQVLLSSLNMFPLGLATDERNLYVTASNTVVSMPLHGGPVWMLAYKLGWPAGITVDQDSLYIADDDGNQVVKVPK